MFTSNLYKRSAVLIVLVSLCLLPLLRAEDPDLPPGPMQVKVRTACMECHESRIILQQRLSKGAWTKEVDRMIKWGAVLDANDRDAFIEYLSANFGTDKPVEPASRVAAGKKR